MVNFLFWFSELRFDKQNGAENKKPVLTNKTEFLEENYFGGNDGAFFNSKTRQITVKLLFDFFEPVLINKTVLYQHDPKPSPCFIRKTGQITANKIL